MIDLGLSDEYLQGFNARLHDAPLDKNQSDDWKMGWTNANKSLKSSVSEIICEKNSRVESNPRAFIIETSNERIIDDFLDTGYREIVKCKDCKYGMKITSDAFASDKVATCYKCGLHISSGNVEYHNLNWYCADGKMG